MYSFIASIGLAVILVLFYLLQTKKIDSDSFVYSIGNALGAFLMLLGQFRTLHITSLLLELIWIAISLYGLSINRNNRDHK
jgi:preprotein translocase subunit SecG